MSFRFGFLLAMVVAAGVGCVDQDSDTDLDDNGAPEIAQVRLQEAYLDSTGAPEVRRVFAFGTQPEATADEEHAVTTATATSQSLRVIMDQLLRGNRLGQIACRDIVGTDPDGQPTMFSDVPDDATPDDIAKCAVSDASLPAVCIGSNLTCLCELPQGCGTGNSIPMGAPVGVLDNNADGAADQTRFKQDSVDIVCGANGEINVPLDLDMSYWNPSGDQLEPAEGGFDALGPAIVLIPLGGVMPTNVTCQLKFADTVISKANQEVCAVPGGRPIDCTGRLADCPEFNVGCTPGDTSAFTFGVQPLSILPPFPDGTTDVSAAANSVLFFSASAPLLLSSLAGITISPAVPDAVISLSSSTSIQMQFPSGLMLSTLYTITFPTTVTDSFGEGLPAPFVLTFTTGTM